MGSSELLPLLWPLGRRELTCRRAGRGRSWRKKYQMSVHKVTVLMQGS